MNEELKDYQKQVKEFYDDSVSILAMTIYTKILALKMKQIKDKDFPFDFYAEAIKALNELLDELNLRNKIPNL
jgi:hypothetical protein